MAVNKLFARIKLRSIFFMFRSVRGVISAAIFMCDRFDECLCLREISVTIHTVVNAIENGNKDVEGSHVKDSSFLKSMRPDKEKRERKRKKRQLIQTGTNRE